MSKVIVIGSGIAGLFSAIKLAEHDHEVHILTKQQPEDSSTNWAQGGSAAILDKTNRDRIEAHIHDTITCGNGMCDENIVRLVVEEAGDRIRDLLSYGVSFQKEDDDFALAKEGGHSQSRILHAKDATGKEIETALMKAVKDHQNISISPMNLVIDLIQSDHGKIEKGVAGVWCLNLHTGKVETHVADCVIIATGGAGQLWAQTTNPKVSTGDGLAMAVRAGASVKDMAFVQFHPTALHVKGERPFLITEAIRGAGAVLLDDEGLKQMEKDPKNPEKFSFTKRYSKQGSLATRDIVARACDTVMKENGASNVWLIASHLDKEMLHDSFPTIEKRLNRHGLSLSKDPLPVAPAAHYMVGGLEVNSVSQALTKKGEIIPGLYAIGEAACTGLHGSNRLASNSLLEGVVFAHRAAENIHKLGRKENHSAIEWRAEGLSKLIEHGPLALDLQTLKATMTLDVGLVRRFSRLSRAKRRVNLLENEIDMIWEKSIPTREIVELRNLVAVAKMITEDAINQKTNSGLHFNLDL